MTLSSVVSEIFMSKNVVTLKSGSEFTHYSYTTSRG